MREVTLLGQIVNLYGRKPRYKTPNQVLAELDAIFKLGWKREIFICDDNFIGNQTHARAILKKIIPWMKTHGEPFSFWTQTSMPAFTAARRWYARSRSIRWPYYSSWWFYPNCSASRSLKPC